MKRTTILKVDVDGETLRVEIHHKMTDLARYESDTRHAKITDKVFAAIAEFFYAQDIKVLR